MVKKVATAAGEIISCVDVNHQPAMNNPLASGAAPLEASEQLKALLSGQVIPAPASAVCPLGSVEMRLPTREQIVARGGLDNFLSKSPGGQDQPPMLAGAAAGPAPTVMQRICLQPSDRIVNQAPCDVQIQPITETDPPVSASRQAQLGPNVMLWIGGKTQAVVNRFPALIEAAKRYPSIKSVYLMDEWGWDGERVQIGLYESEVLWGADIARAAGLQTVISIPPQVVLSPDFKMRDINKFDLIAIDPYPSSGIVSSPGCTFDGNPISTMLYCSRAKLLAQGYRGRVGYIAQGFAIATTAPLETLRQLMLQKATIDKAPAMNIDAFMSWGVYLSLPEIAAKPYLLPLGGTPLERLVVP